MFFLEHFPAGKECACHDIVFHPDAIMLAHKNEKFMRMLTDVSIQSVNSNRSETIPASCALPSLPLCCQILSSPAVRVLKKVKYMGGVPVAQRVRKSPQDGSGPAAKSSADPSPPKPAATATPTKGSRGASQTQQPKEQVG